jgi:hypothetical protein
MRMCSPRRNATDGAQHGEPQEQDRGQFVRPDQRPVEDVARDHAGEQDDDLGDDQQRRRDLDQHARAQRSSERAASERRRGDIASPPLACVKFLA